ncbi:MAG: 7-cyano-7-deazaguanine synthase [SAR202 cluster bacterium]|nr:7-cyano-7-deazaguanine synthase [SAR202 cluster bacterium]
MEKVAVLASGGLDSSVLLADLARSALVYPIYVKVGLKWETEERKAVAAYITALASPNVQPITDISMPVRPLYGDHWGVTGKGVPQAGEADEAVFLPGRNIILIGLAAVWCSTHGVSRIAIGSLGGNPFPDATPEFFRGFGEVLSQGLAHRVEIEAPYRGLHKADIIRANPGLPLHLTLTCMAPANGRHCGRCQKCEERQSSFREAGVEDRTPYS